MLLLPEVRDTATPPTPPAVVVPVLGRNFIHRGWIVRQANSIPNQVFAA
jgi:hypothetical protein